MTVETFDPNHIKITLTAAAEHYIASYLADHPDAVGFRLTTKVAGCSGLTYVTELAEEIRADDVRAEVNANVILFVSKASAPYLQGLEIDYVKEDLGQSSLIYSNPNETGRCGCGESFTVKSNNGKTV